MKKIKTVQPRRLVQETAEKLRELVLANETDAYLGSLQDVAARLGVGIVTVQQAARILEHEGLLAVRRGPGGGYYGTRPDDAAVERAFATYMRIHGLGYRDGLEMMTLFDSELIPAAARCRDKALQECIETLMARIDDCQTPEDRIQFEQDMSHILFKTAGYPLMELLARVTVQLYKSPSAPPIFAGPEGVEVWRRGRRRILEAIYQHDEELARFEANRYRRELLSRLDR